MSSLQARRVLVLGGSGFLGSAIARAFRRSGSEVVVIARTSAHGERLSYLEGCEFVRGDVEAEGSLNPSLDGVDLVVHAVSRSVPAESNADPVNDAATSLGSVLRTLEALKHRPGARLVYLSSGGAIYGNAAELPISETAECLPISSYGVMKLAAEKYLAMYRTLHGISSTSLRIANAYGPGQPVRSSQGFIAACLDALRRDGVMRLYGGGGNVRDYVYVDDVVMAVLEIAKLDDPPTTVNVGSGTGYSLLEVLALVEKVTGAQFQVEHDPRRSVDVNSIVLGTGVLESLMAWNPLDLEEGLRRTWDHAQLATVMRDGTS